MRVAGLPPARGGLHTPGVRQGVHVAVAGPLDALDLPRLIPSPTAPAARPPLPDRPAGVTHTQTHTHTNVIWTAESTPQSLRVGEPSLPPGIAPPDTPGHQPFLLIITD